MFKKVTNHVQQNHTFSKSPKPYHPPPKDDRSPCTKKKLFLNACFHKTLAYLSIYLSMQQSNFTKLHDCNLNSIWRMCKRGDMLRCLPNCVLLASQRSSQPCVCIAKPSTWDVETCQRFFWGGNMYHQYGRPIHVHKLHCIIPKRV